MKHAAIFPLMGLIALSGLDPRVTYGQDSTDSVSIREEASTTEEILPEPKLGPFAGGISLQAHKLRGLTAEVASLVLQSEPGGDIALEALATPLRREGDTSVVPIFVEIDGPTFLEANQSSTARVEIYAYALGPNNQVAGYLGDVFAVDIQKLGEAVWQSGLKYYGHLDLPAGSFRLRVLVRNYQSKAFGLRELPVEILSPSEGQPFLVSPLFSAPKARDVWIPVKEWDSQGEYSFISNEQVVRPTSRPVLVAGRSEQAHLFGYGLPRGSLQGRIELTKGGQPVAQAAIRGEASGSASRFSAVEIQFTTPSVESGVYSLHLALSSGATSPPSTVVVLPAGTRDRGVLWSDLRGQMSQVKQSTSIASTRAAEKEAEAAAKKITRAEKREEAKRLRELANKYKSALATLSEERSSAARLAMLELESSVLTEGSLPDLQTAQLTVANQLADRDLESLIPVIVLHEDLYRTYRQRNLFSLGAYARSSIETLAELYAQRGNSQGSRVVAARTLASLGGYLQAANLPSSSRRLYQRALEHDPGNQAALLGLATSFERYGEYPKAVESLEKLASAHPSFAEGLLRLAINLERLGVRQRAKELTEKVIDLEAPGWIRSLAVQRYARGLLETGDLEKASKLLEESLKENPSQHGTVYLLAHIYDRQREAFRSLDLLRDRPAADGDSESARKQYDSWPEELLKTVRDELEEAASVRRPLIAKALGPITEAGR